MKKTTIAMLAFACAVGMTGLANAGVVVIANPAVSTSALTAEQVSQIFMGRARSLPDGAAVTPIDQAEGSPARTQFNERVLGKNEQQLRSYWSRMIFTGKGQPPRSVPTPEEVIRTVANTPGAIGYIDAKNVSPSVKVLYRAE